MILENLRPVKVLTEDEVKKELYRLNQKKVLAGVSMATGGMALYRICQAFSSSVDGFAQNTTTHVITKFTKEMTKPIVFPYVCTIPTWSLYAGVTGIATLLILAVLLNRKLYKDDTTTHHNVLEVCCVLAPIVAWLLMEVFI